MNSIKARNIYYLIPFIIVYCSISIVIVHYSRIIQEFMLFSRLVILTTALIVLLSVVIIMWRAERIRYERLFPLLALGFGLLYLIVIVPLSVPDEITHYKASYMISSQVLMQPNPEEANAADFDFTDLTEHNNTSDAYRRMRSTFFEEPKFEGLINIGQEQIRSLYFIAEYMPQALGIAVARFLHLNFLQTFYMGRLLNLLLYVVCLAIAIRRVPRFKLTFGMMGILPMALQQAASYSYDSYINGLALIYIASLLKACMEEKTLPKSDYLVLFICSALITPAKGAYSFLVLLYCLIPVTRFHSKREKTLSFLCILFGCVLMFIVTAFPSVRWIVDSSVSLRNTYSLEELISAPGQVVLLIRNTLKINMISWIKGAVGEKLSGLTLKIPEWNIVSMLVLLILSVQNAEDDSFQISSRMRKWFVLVPVMVTIAFLLAMLVTWSNRLNDYISGFQGRYLIPVLPLLIMATSNQLVVVKKNIDMPLSTMYVFLSSYPILYIVEYTIVN